MGLHSLSRQLRTGLLVGIVVGVLALLAVRSRPQPDASVPDGSPPQVPALFRAFERLELAFFDLLASEQAHRAAASEDVALVSIDDESLARARETAGTWPWPRETVGKIVSELRRLGAQLVVVDLALVDSNVRGGGDDDRLANLVDEAGNVVVGFSFTTVPEEGALKPGRWAIRKGRYPTRDAALNAAAPLLARGAYPCLVPAEGQVEVWLGGYLDRATAVETAAAFAGQLGSREQPVIRELAAAEAQDRVTREAVFAERNAITVEGAKPYGLNTFRTLQPPIAQLAASKASFELAELVPDTDGVVRSVRHLVKYDGRFYPSLSLAAALALEGVREVSLTDGWLQAGRLTVPFDAQGATMLRSYGRLEKGSLAESPYESIPAWTVLKSAARRESGRGEDARLAQRVSGKVVFLSADARYLAERTPTPIYPSATSAAVHAAAFDNLRRSDGLVRASPDFDSAVAFAMAMVGAILSLILTRTTRPARTLVLEMAFSLAVAGGFVVWVSLWYRSGLWMATGTPLLAFVAALSLATAVHFADDAKTAAVIHEALGRAVPLPSMEALLRAPGQLTLDGEVRPAALVSCRLRGLSQLNGKLKPKELVRLLSDFSTEVAEAAARNGGQIERLSGGTARIVFGAPLAARDHAARACRCAVELREAVARKRAGWKEKHGIELRFQVGVNAGELIVGNVGARGGSPRICWNAVGPAADLAEQLLALDEALKTEALTSEQTFRGAGGEVAAREVDLVKSPALERPLRVFELLAVKGQVSQERQELVRRFDEALVTYRTRDFVRAGELFAAIAKDYPDDGPTLAYVERCRSYAANPPEDAWEGVWERRAL